MQQKRKHGQNKRKVYLCGLVLLIILVMGMLVACQRSEQIDQESSAVQNEKDDPGAESKDEDAQAPVEEDVPEPTDKDDEKTVSDPEKPQKTEEKPVNKKDDSSYDYSQPVPESEAVKKSYFDDAVFIGDSRTEGFMLSAGLSNATFYSHKGITVKTVFTEPAIKMGGSKVSIMDALAQTEFSKVYIMLGINETGWVYSSMFIESYAQIIDKIKEINPDAEIYVQQILPVSQKVSQEHRYIKNKRIRKYNKLLQEMAAEKEVYYVDVAKAVENEEGVLPEDAAVDGIHLKKDYCKKWLEYLKTHVVE